MTLTQPGRKLILVTRPQPDADLTAARLRALELNVIVAPLFDLRGLATAPPEPAPPFDGLVLTSANGVRALRANQHWPRFAHLPAWCVGATTGQLAQNNGLEIVHEGADLNDLARFLRNQKTSLHLVYPGARDLSADLSGLLAGSRFKISNWPIYAMEPVTALPAGVARAIAGAEIAGVLLYSKRAAATFTALARSCGVSLDSIAALCLSPAIAAHLPEKSFSRILSAPAPDEQSMLGLVSAFANGQIGP